MPLFSNPLSSVTYTFVLCLIKAIVGLNSDSCIYGKCLSFATLHTPDYCQIMC